VKSAVFSRSVCLIAVLALYSASQLVVSQIAGDDPSAPPPSKQEAASQNEEALLEIGKPVLRSIAGDQIHSYRIMANAGDYLRILVEQRAIDVVVTLFAPSGQKILQIDSPNGAYGPEPVLAIAEATGAYRLEIKTFPGSSNSGSYQVQLQELRAASVEDKTRVPLVQAAQRAMDQAVQLANQSSDAARRALGIYEEAATLWRKLKEPYWEALALTNIGQIYNLFGETEKSIDHYNKAFPLQETANDSRGAANSLDSLGELYLRQGDKPKALAYFNRALPLRRAAGDVRGEGLTLVGLGRVHSSLGENKKALEFLNQGLALFKTIAARDAEAVALSNIANIYFRVGDLPKALELLNQAREVFIALRNRSAVAKTLVDIGSVYFEQGDTQKALDLYSQALSFFQGANDRNTEATVLNNIGLVYGRLGDRQSALEFYTRALASYQAIKNKSGEATTLSNIGAFYYLIGESQKALEFYGRALLLRQQTLDPAGEATTLNNMGEGYGALGEKDKALDLFNRALTIRRTIDDKMGQANTLNSIGALYAASQEQRKALEFITEALSLFQAAGNRIGEATTLTNMGGIYAALGETQKALDFYNRSLTLRKAAGDLNGEANTLGNIGTLYSNAGDAKRAMEFFVSALTIRNAIGDRSGEALTLINMMLVAGDINQPLAILFGKRAVNLLQQLRAGAAGLEKEQQKTFLKSKERTYRILAYMLIGAGRLPEAHQVLNLFKDQQFFDFNRDTKQPVSNLTLTPREAALNATFEQATQRIAMVGEQLDKASHKVDPSEGAADRQRFEGQLKTAAEGLLLAVKQAETEFSRATSEGNKVVEIADTIQLQKTLRELSLQTGQKAVAIYTLLDKELEGEGDGSFAALVVSPEGITFTAQPVKADAVNKKALQLWGLLQSDQYDPRPLAAALYSVVFKPIESQLPKGTTTILWSLDGNLRYVPMGALYDGKQYLVERYNHAVFTRPDGERLTRAVSPRWTGLGLGSSEAHTVEVLGDKIRFDALPGVTEELRQLFRQNNSPGGVIDGEVLPDAKFTRTAMLAALKQKHPLVHISSHFSFRPGDEARSFLLLGDGTAMTLEEMKKHLGLFSGVELLTLSACNTAAQQEGNGREIDGFAELAQRLGAASVMATLWPVADNSTPWLMREFYQSRQSGQGLSKAEAFRRAQLALLNGTAETKPLPAGHKGAAPPIRIVIGEAVGNRDSGGRGADVVYVDAEDAPRFVRDDKKPFAHPHYWAPFILIGNWK
jgi:CHAT domain-containing protein/tetratricopeptide (TPR) repeat protein